MASGPPQACCVTGVTHTGTPVGSVEHIGGIRCYVTRPAEKSQFGVLYIPDAFGIEYINNQLVADDIARAGYLVAIPDIFDGDAVPQSILTTGPGSFRFPPWAAQHPPARVDAICEAVIAALKSAEHDVVKLGAVGYCFGARYVVRFLASGGDRGVEAGFIAHPSGVTVEELEAVAKPLSLACAEVDSSMSTEMRRKSEDILLAKSPLPYQVVVYSGVQHGFAVRSDVSKRVCRFAKESAYFQAVRWMDEWLKNGD